MTATTARIHVAADQTISGTALLAAGEYIARIEIPEQAGQQPLPTGFDLDDLPVHYLSPWPEGLSLRREDMYGDDGR